MIGTGYFDAKRGYYMKIMLLTLIAILGITSFAFAAQAETITLKRGQQKPAAKGEIFIVNLSGRGDKDIDIYRENFPELDS